VSVRRRRIEIWINRNLQDPIFKLRYLRKPLRRRSCWAIGLSSWRMPNQGTMHLEFVLDFGANLVINNKNLHADCTLRLTVTRVANIIQLIIHIERESIVSINQWVELLWKPGFRELTLHGLLCLLNDLQKSQVWQLCHALCVSALNFFKKAQKWSKTGVVAVVSWVHFRGRWWT
jgi:hypothetical protein